MFSNVIYLLILLCDKFSCWPMTVHVVSIKVVPRFFLKMLANSCIVFMFLNFIFYVLNCLEFDVFELFEL